MSVRVILGLAGIALLIAVSPAHGQQKPQDLLQAGRYAEEVEGDLKAAVRIFQGIIADFPSHRTVVAEALIRLGRAYETLGERGARQAYERVLSNYADQAEAAAEARSRLASLQLDAKAEAGAATPQDEPRALPEPGYTSSITPDGRRGAFNAIDGYGMNVRVIDYETGEITRVTDLEWQKSNGIAWGGIWAPDSRRMAYSQVTPDGITEIRVSVPGETPRVIFRNEGRQDSGHTAMVFDWLHDGSALVVSVRQDDASNTLGLVSLKDGSFTQLRTVPWQGDFISAPKASLDDRFLLIQEDGDLFLLATDGSGKVSLTDHPAADGGFGLAEAMWSQDGKHVLFTSDRSGTKGLWALLVEDGRRAGPPFLLQANWDGHFLGWAGGEFAYGRNLNIQNIYTVPVDPESGETTGVAKLIPYPETGGYLQFPAWSADGREIAFLADTHTPSARLVIQPFEGGRAREYPVPEGMLYPMTALRWLPDGTGISFMAQNRQDRPILVRVALAEGDWQTTPLPENTRSSQSAFEWSPTGESFYYIQVAQGSDDLPSRSSLIEHHVTTGAEEVLHTLDGRIGRLALSPDGGELAVSRGMAINREHLVFSRETGSVRQLVPAQDGGSQRWSPDGWHLTISCDRGICIVDVGTGNVTKVDFDPVEVLSRTMGTTLKLYATRNYLLSPAGDRIVFTLHGTSEQVMIMADPLDAALEGQSSSSSQRR